VIFYQIFEDNIPENTEVFQLSAVVSNPSGTPDIDYDPTFRSNCIDFFSDLQVQICDDDGEFNSGCKVDRHHELFTARISHSKLVLW